MNTNQVKVSTLGARLRKMSKESIDNTISLAYYTLVQGDVSALKNVDQTVTTLLHPVYRQFVCAKYKDGVWEYSKAKSVKLLEALGDLEYKKTTFEEFVKAVEAYQATIDAKKADLEAQEQALSPTEVEAKEKDKVLNYLARTNLTVTQLKDLVLLVERTRTEKVKLKTAA